MTVKLTAIKNAGFGCVKGEVKIYENMDIVEDKGDYYSIRKNTSFSIYETRAKKDNFTIEISN